MGERERRGCRWREREEEGEQKHISCEGRKGMNRKIKENGLKPYNDNITRYEFKEELNSCHTSG